MTHEQALDFSATLRTYYKPEARVVRLGTQDGSPVYGVQIPAWGEFRGMTLYSPDECYAEITNCVLRGWG